jgi:hypothetical protein
VKSAVVKSTPVPTIVRHVAPTNIAPPIARVQSAAPAAPAAPRTATVTPRQPAQNIPPRAAVPTPRAPIQTVAPRTTAHGDGNRIGIFIDLDNTYASLRNIQEIISICGNYGDIVYGKFYGYIDSSDNIFKSIVRDHGFETAPKSPKVHSHSVIDLRLVMESIDQSLRGAFDTAFIWAGQGDLTMLYSKLAEIGIATMTVDLDEFDNKNPYITRAVQLFSTYNFPKYTSGTISGGATTRVSMGQVSAPAFAANPDGTQPPAETIGGIKQTVAPVILPKPSVIAPRKDGAPAFNNGDFAEGDTAEEIEEDDDAPIDEEEYSKMIIGSVADVFLNGGKNSFFKLESADEDTEGEGKREEPSTPQGDDFGGLTKKPTATYDGQDDTVAKDGVTETQEDQYDTSNTYAGFADDFGGLTGR